MALGDILQTFRSEKPESVLGKVDRYLLSLNGKKFKDTEHERETGVWHPSSLSTIECIRRLTYIWLGTTPSNPDRTSARARRIFDVGHHSGYQNQGYFWDMGILEGVWKCVRCDHMWWDTSPRKCPKCEAKMEIWYNLHYAEVPVVDPDYNIKGHGDGLLNENGTRKLLELKTIKNKDANTRSNYVTFEDLNAPKLEHLYQTNLYMYLLEKFGPAWRGAPNFSVKTGVIIYNAKNTQEPKDYPLALVPEFVTPMYLKIDKTIHALKGGYLPNRISEDKGCGHCKWCPFRDLCHSGEHSFREVDNRKEMEAVAL